MNCVSFETALRLRDAGFPRENEFNIDRMFFFKYPHQDFYHLMNGEKAYQQMQDVKRKSDLWDVVHAPTATELLPDGFSLRFREGRFSAWNDREIEEIASDTNPAEAAAAAWLHVNATKTTETI